MKFTRLFFSFAMIVASCFGSVSTECAVVVDPSGTKTLVLEGDTFDARVSVDCDKNVVAQATFKDNGDVAGPITFSLNNVGTKQKVDLMSKAFEAIDRNDLDSKVQTFLINNGFDVPKVLPQNDCAVLPCDIQEIDLGDSKRLLGSADGFEFSLTVDSAKTLTFQFVAKSGDVITAGPCVASLCNIDTKEKWEIIKNSLKITDPFRLMEVMEFLGDNGFGS